MAHDREDFRIMKHIDSFEEIYVTADLHLSNDRLNRTIRERGFTDPKEHTLFIRNLINNIIKDRSATLYIIGDLGFKDDDESMVQFIKSLTPRVKVAFGNHDSIKQLTKLWKLGVFQDCKHEYEFEWRNNYFHLHHLPLAEWGHFFDNGYCCFGHTHGTIKPFLRAMDIGLDANNMRILSLTEVVKLRKDFNNVNENRERLGGTIIV